MKYLRINKLTLNKLSIILIITAHSAFSQSKEVMEVSSNKNYQLRAIAELGYIGVFDHKLQFGKNTTYFDYKKDGGQDVLFPASRLSLEMDYNNKNTLILLYQPLRIESEVVLNKEVIIDDITFPDSSNLNLLYNFPFYRLSYLRDLNLSSERFNLALGLSFQIRNATIKFESADGKLRQVNRDLGPVPILKFRAQYEQNEDFKLELECDGMYAPISYLNGSDNEVVGAILDASLRQKIKITDKFTTFLNLRYLGGGAEGNSDNTQQVSDGYTKNWLHFYNVSTGFQYQF
jgi:hypothetical protein